MPTSQLTEELTVHFRSEISAGRLATNLKAVRAATGEAIAELTSTGIRLTGVDEATTVRVATFLAAEAFESYTLEGEETIGLNVSRMADAVAQFESDTSLRLTMQSPAKRLKIKGEFLELSFGLLDSEAMPAVPDPPEAPRPIVFTVNGRTLSRAVRACSLVYGDNSEAEDDDSEQPMAAIGIGVDVESDSVYAQAEGDTDTAHYKLKLEGLDIASDPENFSTRFGMDNLRDITRPIPANAEVTSMVGDQMPLRFRWLFAEENGSVEYDLAPVVSDAAPAIPDVESPSESESNTNDSSSSPALPAMPSGIEATGETLRLRENRLSEFTNLLERRPEAISAIQRIEFVTESGDGIVLWVEEGQLVAEVLDTN